MRLSGVTPSICFRNTLVIGKPNDNLKYYNITYSFIIRNPVVEFATQIWEVFRRALPQWAVKAVKQKECAVKLRRKEITKLFGSETSR